MSSPYTERRTAQLVGEINLLRAALHDIEKQCGEVCGDYELCTHESCRITYTVRSLAEEALRKVDVLAYNRQMDDGDESFLAELDAAKTEAERAQILEDNK